MPIKKSSQVIILLFLPLLVGFSSSLLAGSMPNPWFETLIKPAINPPSWIFGPVWALLYLLMGLSLILISKVKTSSQKTLALSFFFAQLALNFLWSPLFFGLHEPFWALIDLVLIDIFVIFTLIIFWKIKPKAAYLLLPYLFWIFFATFLNFQIWQLNFT